MPAAAFPPLAQVPTPVVATVSTSAGTTTVGPRAEPPRVTTTTAACRSGETTATSVALAPPPKPRTRKPPDRGGRCSVVFQAIRIGPWLAPARARLPHQK